jgi:transitional endoplasmic reticulum ATPase
MDKPPEAHVVISFGPSTAASFDDAKRLARQCDLYRVTGTGRLERHSVRIALSPVDPDTLTRLKRLFQLIAGWKSSSLELEGAPTGRRWSFHSGMEDTYNCYQTQRLVQHGDDYCRGKNTPTDEVLRFGCRLEQPVQRSHVFRAYESAPHWCQYGRLSEDASTFAVDKPAVLAALRVGTCGLPCTLCPAFSWDRIEAGVARLPDRIDLRTDERFKLKFSTDDPKKAIGVEPTKHFTTGSRLESTPGSAREGSEPRPERQIPSTRYSDVAAQDAALGEIEHVVGLPLKHPQYYDELGVEPHSGVLLYGPPGNGKTLIAKAVAGEAQAHLEIINGPEVLSMWVGQSEANLRKVFGRARSLAPSVVLIDEIDSIAATRDEMIHQHEVSLISQLLVLLDGLERRGRVAVIATTNRIDAIDPAIRRPGRFDYHIEVPEPDLEGRAAILKSHLSHVKVTAGISPADLARETGGFSGADLAAVVREAGQLAILRGLREKLEPQDLFVTPEDLMEAVHAMRAKRLAHRRDGPASADRSARR